MQYERKTANHWGPFLEWTIEAAAESPEAYDISATTIFAHRDSGTKVSTGIFPAGPDTWAFRFANSSVGDWTFETHSDLAPLSGHTGTLTVEPDPNTRGTLTHTNRWWSWSESGDVIVPQLAMYDSPAGFYNQPDKINADIETFFDGHGFNGFHVPVFCRWLDLDKEANPEFDDADPLPDARTFEAIELLNRKTYAAGGFVHLWLWGDNDANHKMTPMRDDWGGKNGRVARRLNRYIAARLGPVIGWSMGYGFDLEHWVGEEDLKTWYEMMTADMGWSHFLGGRSGRPKDDPELKEIYQGMDYASYTHHRPGCEDYLAASAAHPDKPVFSEDRFRIRESDRFRFKDYTEEATRQGIWHSTMAGGVANIWGKMAEGAQNGQSVPFPNAEHLVTAARFFQGRLSAEMTPEACSDGYCLKGDKLVVIYKEDCDTISLDLSSESGDLGAVCVDAISPYHEMPVTVTADKQDIRLPHRSDWAVAISVV